MDTGDHEVNSEAPNQVNLANPVRPLLATTRNPKRRAALHELVPMWDAVSEAVLMAEIVWPDAYGETRDRVPLAATLLLEEARDQIRGAGEAAARGDAALDRYTRAADLLAVLAMGAERLPAELAAALDRAVRACAADDASAPVHDVLQAVETSARGDDGEGGAG